MARPLAKSHPTKYRSRVRQPFSGLANAAVTYRRFSSRLASSLGVGFHTRIIGDVDPDVDVRLAAEVPDE